MKRTYLLIVLLSLFSMNSSVDAGLASKLKAKKEAKAKEKLRRQREEFVPKDVPQGAEFYLCETYLNDYKRSVYGEEQEPLLHYLVRTNQYELLCQQFHILKTLEDRIKRFDNADDRELYGQSVSRKIFLNLRNNNNQTVLDVASKTADPMVMALVLSNGALR